MTRLFVFSAIETQHRNCVRRPTAENMDTYSDAGALGYLFLKPHKNLFIKFKLPRRYPAARVSLSEVKGV